MKNIVGTTAALLFAILLVVVRQETAWSDDPPSDAAPDSQLLGNWEITKYTESGKEDRSCVGYAYQITEKEIIRLGVKETERFSYRIDAKNSTIDLIVIDGETEIVLKGIYEVSGDTLKICRSCPDKPRPKLLSTKLGDELALYVFKRVRPMIE